MSCRSSYDDGASFAGALVVFVRRPVERDVTVALDAQTKLPARFGELLERDMSELGKTEAQIASETKELIFKFEEDCLIKAYTDNTDDYKHYTSGWSQTIDAVNNGRVEVLFLKSKLFMQGYLDEMQNLQLEPAQGSQTLKNIVPWIIKKVISSAGTVRIIYDNDDLNAVDISAKLRY